VDIPLPKKQNNPIQFTFLWLDEDRWEGQGLRREQNKRRRHTAVGILRDKGN
jgi:hypothetical protein